MADNAAFVTHCTCPITSYEDAREGEISDSCQVHNNAAYESGRVLTAREDAAMTYPRPHENVTGTDRDPHLLSLDDDAMPTRRLLVNLIDAAWSGCLIGNAPPTVRERYERMKEPRVGDLVVEMTARYGGDRLVKGVGFLVGRRTEWFHTDEQWAEQRDDYEGDPRPTDEAWYVQYGPAAGDVCRWTNCMFIASPVIANTDLGRVPDVS